MKQFNMLPLSVGLRLVRPESIPRNNKFDYNFSYSNSGQIDSIFILFLLLLFIFFFSFIIHLFSFFSCFFLLFHISFFKFDETKNK